MFHSYTELRHRTYVANAEIDKTDTAIVHLFLQFYVSIFTEPF